MRDSVTIAIEDSSKCSSLKSLLHIIHIPGNDGLVEDLSAGQIRVQVDIGRQDEVLVVIINIIA